MLLSRWRLIQSAAVIVAVNMVRRLLPLQSK